MFGTYERFNLVRVSFARSGSNTYIAEDYYKHGLLRLGNNWTGDSVNSTDFLFDIKLTKAERRLNTHILPMRAPSGCVRRVHCGNRSDRPLALSHPRRKRRAEAGAPLRVRNGARACRDLRPARRQRMGGRVRALREALFKALAGNYNVVSVFDDDKNEYSLVRIDFMPDIATGEFEAAVHDYRDKLIPFGEYEDFEQLVENNRVDFEQFSQIYAEPAPGYKEMSKYARWIVWSHRTKAIGMFKQPHILFQNSWSAVAALAAKL